MLKTNLQDDNEKNAQPRTSRSPKRKQTSSNSVAPILSYCASSILMTLTNKYCLSGLDFNVNFLFLAIQSTVCIVAIRGCKAANLISFRDFNSSEAKQWFPISVLLVGMIYTGSQAIKLLPIPVYSIFKNLTIIVIAYGEVLWFGSSVTRLALASFGLIVLSSIISAWADIQRLASFDGEVADTRLRSLHMGYTWMLLNCFCTASYVLGMRKRIKLTNFKDFDTMFYNNLLSLPILLISSLVVEDWSSENIHKNFPVDNRNTLMFAIILSGLSSIFISYTSAWCVRVTTSTTYSMVGALNKIPIALSGLLFNDAPVTIANISAIAVGGASGLLYSYAKIVEKRELSNVLPK